MKLKRKIEIEVKGTIRYFKKYSMWDFFTGISGVAFLLFSYAMVYFMSELYYDIFEPWGSLSFGANLAWTVVFVILFLKRYSHKDMYNEGFWCPIWHIGSFFGVTGFRYTTKLYGREHLSIKLK
jgi:hypothetical protein